MVFLDKDITTIEEGIIAHGVNCQKVMGAGVAKAIAKKWPIVKESYYNLSKKEMMLGEIQPVFIHDSPLLIIINCFTQFSYGRKGQYASEDAIIQSLRKSSWIALDYNIHKIYIPRIGCGLGGLSWNNVQHRILNEIEKETPLNFIVCNKPTQH